MSHTPSDNRKPSPVKIVPASRTNYGPIDVDCSSWDAEPGSAPRQSQPARSAAVNVGGFDVEFIEPKSIEIVMDLEECASKAAAFQLAMELILAVTQAAPDLKLLYDPERTRQADGTVTIVLTPQVFLANDRRLKEMVEWINSSPRISRISPGGKCVGTAHIAAA